MDAETTCIRITITTVQWGAMLDCLTRRAPTERRYNWLYDYGMEQLDYTSDLNPDNAEWTLWKWNTTAYLPQGDQRPR